MFNLFHKTDSFLKWRDGLSSQLQVGLVPTMGNLHAGHLSLTNMSLKDNDVTIVTIFVNPKQFAPHEDLEKYPRTLDHDVQKLKEALSLNSNKNLCVFAPQNAQEIYPPGDHEEVLIDHPMSKVMCGHFRPGHFDGVTTVVSKLFKITAPQHAYFGEKDFQQLSIIKHMCKEHQFPINIISGPIVRDHDGLALSSRNQYLSQQERKAALTLPRTLKDLKHKIINQEPDLDAQVSRIIENDQRWQYLEVRDKSTLAPIKKGQSSSIVIAGSYLAGNTRLIDNVIVK